MPFKRLLPTLALLPLLIATACAVPPVPPVAPAPTPPPTPEKVAGAAAWALLEHTLPGTWTMPSKAGPFTVSYGLISGGSVLVETWGVGSPRQTMTIFHPDQDELLLTHYCAQGNQPRLRAVTASADAVVFRFADATNLRPGQAVLVERSLRFGADVFDDTDVYRQADGTNESTTYHFTRACAER